MERRTGQERRENPVGGRRKGDKVSCPYCLHPVSSVLPTEAQTADGGYLRTRRCDACRRTYTTIEKVA